jgi:hypothetical protein
MFEKVTSKIFRNCMLIWPTRTVRRFAQTRCRRVAGKKRFDFLRTWHSISCFAGYSFWVEKSSEPDGNLK